MWTGSIRSIVRSPKVRDEVATEVAAVILDRRALALLDPSDVFDVALAGFRHGLALGPPDHDRVLLHATPQLGLRLGARQTVT
jgi:hypothetical protein